MKKRLRCKDCIGCLAMGETDDLGRYRETRVVLNPAQFACKRFVYKDK